MGRTNTRRLFPFASSKTLPPFDWEILWQGKVLNSSGYWKVNNGIAVTMICIVAGIAAFGFYFFISPDTSKTKTDDCVAAATSIPLVNTTTGMGMTAAVAECE